MHEHPLQRFFRSLRERPVFAWERYQPVSYTHLTLPTILLV